MYTKHFREGVTPLIKEKTDTRLKQFWSNDKRNTELFYKH